MYIYYKYDISNIPDTWYIKIGQTSNLSQRQHQIGYVDRFEYFDCSLADALFIESYLRVRFENYGKQHPEIKMTQAGLDYFYLDSACYKEFKDKFIKYYEKWVYEAYQIICNIHNTLIDK